MNYNLESDTHEKEQIGYWSQLNRSIIAATFGIVIFVYSAIFSFSPLNGEDYALALNQEKSDLSLLEKFFELTKMSIHQASTWNARLGEQLSIFWLSTSKSLFVAANAITFILFCIALAKLGSRSDDKRKEFLENIFIVVAAIFILWPRYEIFFWGTTVAGYLMPITVTLWVLTFFNNPTPVTSNNLKFAALLLMCIAAGYSFENVPAAVAPYMFLIVIAEFRNNSPTRFKLTIAAGAYIFSWMALMLTPSTIYRTKWYREALHTPAPSVELYTSQLGKVIDTYVSTALPLLISAVLFFIISTSTRTAPKSNYKTLLLLAPITLCILSVIAAPYIEPRAFLLSWCILISLLVYWGSPILRRMPEKYAAIIISLLSVTAIATTTNILTSYVEFSSKVNLRAGNVQTSSKEACEAGIDFPLIKDNYDPRMLNNRDDWVENNMNRVEGYFGCKLKPRH